MKLNRSYLVILALALFVIFILTPTVRADEWNKRTVVTIDEAIQLPNVVLQPGSYVFKLLDSESDRHIVQISDKDEKHVITTILAMPNYQLQPKGKSVFTFWETPAGTPPALRAWFYPGDQFGQEFAYPKNLSTQLAASNNTPVLTTPAQSADDMKNAPVTSMSEVGQQNELDSEAYKAPKQTSAAAAPPPPTPAPTPAADQAPPPASPEPAPAPVPSELPATGSQLPLIGLIGATSLAAALVLSGIRRSSVR